MNVKVVILSLMALSFSLPTLADEIYQENAVAVCKDLKQKTYVKKCLTLIKTAKFNDTALQYCKSQSSWNKIKSCLSLIKNARYEPAPLAICQSGKHFNSTLKGCLGEIAEKSYVSSIEVDLCTQESTYKKQIKCLKGAASGPYVVAEVAAEVNSDVELKLLQGKVKEAYELLRNNKTADATIMMHNLVNQFDKPSK